MRKFGVITAALLVLLAVGTYLLSGIAVQRGTDAALGKIAAYGARSGVELRNMSYEDASLRGLSAIVWKGISLEAIFPDRGAGERRLTVSAKNIILEPISVADSAFSISGSGLDILWSGPGWSDSGATTSRHLEQCEFWLQFPLDVFSPAESVPQVRQTIEELVRFFHTGRAKAVVGIDGLLTFAYKGQPLKAKVEATREGDEYVLVMDRKSLQAISDALDEKLTEPEQILFARNPLKMVRLLAIRNDARDTAHQTRLADGSISEDAYRHVLWSYLLTRDFGPEFAKEVTDAHEQGLTDNTEADHVMDYRNNEVGRSYALNNYTREDLLSRFRNDAAIIRDPAAAPVSQ